MSELPLQGLTLLNTRPHAQARLLTQLLEDLGATVIELPMLEIIPVGDKRQFNQTLCDLPADSIVIFLSANAVIQVADQWPEHNTKIHVIAIGPGTEKILENNAIPVAAVPQEFSSAGLLALPELQDVAGKSVFIFCGEKPNQLTPDTLEQRGAQVELVTCYRRVKPKLSQLDYETLFQADIDLIITTSLEGVRNLYQCLGGQNSDWISQLPILVISAKMRNFLQRQEHPSKIIESHNASNKAIVETLIAWKHQQL